MPPCVKGGPLSLFRHKSAKQTANVNDVKKENYQAILIDAYLPDRSSDWPGVTSALSYWLADQPSVLSYWLISLVLYRTGCTTALPDWPSSQDGCTSKLPYW